MASVKDWAKQRRAVKQASETFDERLCKVCKKPFRLLRFDDQTVCDDCVEMLHGKREPDE